MQIVIDVSEEEYDAIKAGRSVFLTAQRGGGKTITIDLIKAVRNGIPLPKGHGRLIDADAATKTVQTFEDAFCVCCSSTGGVTIACTAPTIIDADKEVPDDSSEDNICD